MKELARLTQSLVASYIKNKLYTYKKRAPSPKYHVRHQKGTLLILTKCIILAHCLSLANVYVYSTRSICVNKCPLETAKISKHTLFHD